jgi:hypothetical protein
LLLAIGGGTDLVMDSWLEFHQPHPLARTFTAEKRVVAASLVMKNLLTLSADPSVQDTKQQTKEAFHELLKVMKLNGGEVEFVDSYQYRKPPPDPNAAPNPRPERPPFAIIKLANPAMKAPIFYNERQLSLSEVKAHKHVLINYKIPACVRAAVKEKEIAAFNICKKFPGSCTRYRNPGSQVPPHSL